MVPRFVEALFEFFWRCWTLVYATSVFMDFTSSRKSIWGEVGNRGQRLRYREGDIEVVYNRRQTRVGVGLVKTKNTGWGLRGGVTYITLEKEGEYMSLEKIYVCACILRTEINYLENKNRSWLCSTRVDGMQEGRGLTRVGLIYSSKTLGDNSKTTLGMPF